MKALVRKYPINADKEELNEVYCQPWLDWISEDGSPLTDENYAYALCEECPDGAELTVDDFEVEEHTKEVPDESGEEGKTKTMKYWTAEYVGGVEDGAR